MMTAKYHGERTGMGHRKHPLLGQQVIDNDHGCRIGVLRAIAPDLDMAPKPAFIPVGSEKDRADIDTADVFAWLSPPGGGLEWKTDVGSIIRAQ